MNQIASLAALAGVEDEALQSALDERIYGPLDGLDEDELAAMDPDTARTILGVSIGVLLFQGLLAFGTGYALRRLLNDC